MDKRKNKWKASLSSKEIMMYNINISNSVISIVTLKYLLTSNWSKMHIKKINYNQTVCLM